MHGFFKSLRYWLRVFSKAASALFFFPEPCGYRVLKEADSILKEMPEITTSDFVKMIRKRGRDVMIGIWLVFLFAIVVIIAGVVLAMMNHDTIAIVLVGVFTFLVFLARIFEHFRWRDCFGSR